ncbi:hypothetical protein KIPB_009800 [Kipferlia bialata]|uniref:RING-type domain-containing protein n=1 Tax=Kipferlia bialata TaxID=797122 RepID=A0A9K3GL35_9EUKA|nr:hypothetical protein KIPB_009800 [Kipferlia bialata]|eukprot:g9800.t1
MESLVYYLPHLVSLVMATNILAGGGYILVWLEIDMLTHTLRYRRNEVDVSAPGALTSLLKLVPAALLLPLMCVGGVPLIQMGLANKVVFKRTSFLMSDFLPASPTLIYILPAIHTAGDTVRALVRVVTAFVEMYAFPCPMATAANLFTDMLVALAEVGAVVWVIVQRGAMSALLEVEPFFVLMVAGTVSKAARRLTHYVQSMRRLQYFPPAPADVIGSESVCPICFEAHTAQSMQLPCLHCVHRRCLQQWIPQKAKPECPLCRKVIEFPEKRVKDAAPTPTGTEGGETQPTPGVPTPAGHTHTHTHTHTDTGPTGGVTGHAVMPGTQETQTQRQREPDRVQTLWLPVSLPEDRTLDSMETHEVVQSIRAAASRFISLYVSAVEVDRHSMLLDHEVDVDTTEADMLVQGVSPDASDAHGAYPGPDVTSVGDDMDTEGEFGL